MTAQDGWYYAHGQETNGPLSLADLVGKLPAETGMNTLVFGPGIAEWTEARHVAAIVEFSRGNGAPPPPPAGGRRSDEIDYEICGEGFIMQRLTGDGIALIHAGGTMMKRSLTSGETLRIDTGCLVAITPSVQYDIQFIGGIKNTLFGGEGLFFATLTGPGEVWLQSLPFSRLAGRIIAAAGKPGGKEEGSVLGGLGKMLSGDNE